jgi:GT2 family glycosyltransferase
VAPFDVVVVTYNSAAHVRSSLEPLCADPDARVVVVDSASSDDTLTELRGLRATVISLEVNLGFGHACNVGWRKGGAPYVLFLNPDAHISADAVRMLVAGGEQAPSAGAVAPRIIDEHGALDYSQRRFPRLRSTYAQALFLHRVIPRAGWTDELVRDDQTYERRTSPEWASGACLLVRRDSLERLGGFDEGFFLYCEDMDLCRRLRELGLEILFLPEAVAVHEGGASMPRGSLLPVLAESRVRFARKHRGRLVCVLEGLGVALGSLTHALLGRSAMRRGHLAAVPVALGLRQARRP